MGIEIRDTDIAFTESPDTGHPDCTCSRCSHAIKEDECCIRALTTNENGEEDENSKEYRFCAACSLTMGLVSET